MYCPGCGYAILVVGHWDGEDFSLSLRDGLLDKDSPSITACPHCGRGVAPDDLDFVPPLAPPLRWPRESWEQAPDLDMDLDMDMDMAAR